MSLVGSLEDLGLGDILQIVAMARKSGLLLLRTDAGEGRIVVCEGLVHSASAKGGAEDLRGLLVAGGHASESEYELATEFARDQGCSLDHAFAEKTPLTRERLEAVRREHVERAVTRMFSWRAGEFSFDVREDLEQRDRDFMLSVGLDTQYLAMEAARLADEGERVAGDFDPAEAPDAEAAEEVTVPPPVARAADAGAEAQVEPEPAESGSAPGAATAARSAGLIAIDPDLGALEWIKTVLADVFDRIHIFQRSESGISRIRQYLRRGEEPVVLLSASAHPDIAMDTGDLVELVSRLRTQAPRMPLVLMFEEGSEPPPECDGVGAVVARPASQRLGRDTPELEAAARTLQEALRPWARAGGS